MNERVITSGLLYSEEDLQNLSNKRKTYLKIKRIIDVSISLISLILLFPIFIIISILIKLDSKGKVFFKHKRIGKDGKIIYLYKFRTMVDNAEELIKNFNEEQKKEYEEKYKLSNDPRITRIGKILRKTSLDELPQLINILKGDMSLIGPRPIVEKELEKYGMLKNRFLSVTPGLTGYWACNGRSCTSYDDRIKLELYYIYNCCLKLDIKIFFTTIIAVVKRNGAL